MKIVYIYRKHSYTPKTVSQLDGFVKEDEKTIEFNRPLDWKEVYDNNLSVYLFYKAE